MARHALTHIDFLEFPKAKFIGTVLMFCLGAASGDLDFLVFLWRLCRHCWACQVQTYELVRTNRQHDPQRGGVYSVVAPSVTSEPTRFVFFL